jgi:benzoyl-CoA reductase/2-hydroxyglutaryl-CoA dehydratase subunit BcrC/BadD/HgdB
MRLKGFSKPFESVEESFVVKKSYRKLKVAKELTRMMTRYYAKIKLTSRLQPVAWVSSGAPVEVLVALGVLPLYPENYGAILGAQRAAVPLIEGAEARGYSSDLCSYAVSHLGSVFAPEKAPMRGLPKPDMLVASNNICGTVVKWYEALADHFNVPLFILDTPYMHGPEMEDHVVSYVAAQMEAFIAWAEKQTGRRLRQKKFRQTLELANQAVDLWREIRELCVHRPSPLNAPDLFTQMAPIVVLRGARQCVDYYGKLKAEVEERVEKDLGAVPDEQYRLLWDNIAIWPGLFRFYHLFSRAGACFVCDTYTHAWSVGIQADDPIEGLARAYTAVYINMSVQTRVQVMVAMAKRFGVDGAVLHANRSCKPYSLGQHDFRLAIMEEVGVPAMILEADMCDTRAYAEGAVKTRVEAFLEMLAG